MFVAQTRSPPTNGRFISVALQHVGILLAAMILTVPLAIAAADTQAKSKPSPSPDLSLPLLDGSGSIRLQDLSGQVIYVDFWASWCAPCRRSLPTLERWYLRLKQRGFTVLAVNLDRDADAAHRFLQRYSVSYPIGHDQTGAAASAWEVKAMPSGYLIDRQGHLRYTHRGFKKTDEAELLTQITALLAESPKL